MLAYTPWCCDFCKGLCLLTTCQPVRLLVFCTSRGDRQPSPGAAVRAGMGCFVGPNDLTLDHLTGAVPSRLKCEGHTV